MTSLSEVKPLSPTATVSRMIDLLSAERLGVDGYSQRCAYLAKEQLDELVRDLLSNGQMMAWSVSYEAENNNVSVRVISRDEMYLPPTTDKED